MANSSSALFWQSRVVIACSLLFCTVALSPGGCAAVRRAKEKQSTSAQARVAASRDSVRQAALEVLPGFDLIATSDYEAAGFIEARGDWGTPHEGAVVQISSRADGDATRVVVEAGRSASISRSEMRALARAVLDGILTLLSGQPTSGP